LRHRVTIEEVTRSGDDQGGFTETWTGRNTVWAGVEPLRGQERFEAQKINPKTTHKVILRYLEGLTPVMRVRFGDRIFNVEEIINPSEKNESMELRCSEEYEA